MCRILLNLSRLEWVSPLPILVSRYSPNWNNKDLFKPVGWSFCVQVLPFPWHGMVTHNLEIVLILICKWEGLWNLAFIPFACTFEEFAPTVFIFFQTVVSVVSELHVHCEAGWSLSSWCNIRTVDIRDGPVLLCILSIASLFILFTWIALTGHSRFTVVSESSC